VRSTFVSEIISGSNIEVVKAQVDEPTLTEYLALQFAATAVPEIELVDKAYIDQLLKNYSLSVTHLSNYLQCPVKFYYQNLIKVPAARGEALTFGSAVHFALQRLFEKMKNGNNSFPVKEDMLNDFSWYMHLNRESFTKDQFRRRMEYGQKIIPAYYDFYISSWNKVVVLEKQIRNVEIKGVPLNGKLDKLEFNGKQVNVVDYKTGKYENGLKKPRRPTMEDPIGGDYWRQAVFYKILLDNDRSNDWQTVSVEFDFVEPVKNEYKKERIVVTPEDVDIVSAQITDTWNRIKSHDFSKGCGKEDCDWCNFIKNNQLNIALAMATEEE
jgi:DNA helicase-2/ATP-dependent DNA helicase PcrA